MHSTYMDVLFAKTKWKIFTPDNAITPIFRHKLFNRLAEPGYSYINRITESALPAIKTSIRVGHFNFSDLLSQDNVPITAECGFLYRFDPRTCQPHAVAQFVQVGDEVFHAILEDFATEGLLHLLSYYQAKQLKEDAVLNLIKKSLRHYLNSCIRPLGLSLPFPECVIIKKLMPHERFLRTQLEVLNQVSKIESMMALEDGLFDQFTRMEILNILENMKNGSTVFTNFSESTLQPSFAAGAAQSERGANGRDAASQFPRNRGVTA